MNVFHYSLYLFLFIWGISCNWTFFAIYLSILGSYFFMASRIPDSKCNTLRSKIRIASWSEPLEGNIRSRYEVDVTKIIAFIESLPKDGPKVTITHVVIKAIAEILKNTPDINGRISFGKYVPFDDVTVTCLIDIEGGKDLAAVAIQNCDKLTLEEISDYIRDRASKVRNKQDTEHNKRTGAFSFIPTGAIKPLFIIVHFIANVLGMNIEAIQIKKFAFGAATVTSLGMLEVKDCWSPNNLIIRSRFVVSVNEVERRATVVNGNVEIRPMMNLNFTVDHRYVDGGRAKKIAEIMSDVFENPEKYSSKTKI